MNDLLTDDLYVRFHDLVQRRCGLFYPETRRSDLTHRLRMALRDTHFEHLEGLYAEAVKGGAAWDGLVEHLTIGETYFFRNGPQFDALRTHILPELIKRRVQGGSLRCLRLWSAGCATGEEPYSLAMLVNELLPDHHKWFINILGTDINTTFLARARDGVYGDWSFRETAHEQRERWFVPDGQRWRVRPDVRRMVTFAHLNLMEQSYPSLANGTSGLDLILCRNVTIYFDEATTQQIIDRMYDALTPGGWLVVGHSEPRAYVYQRFETHNFPQTVVYRKPLDGPVFPSAPAPLPALHRFPHPTTPQPARLKQHLPRPPQPLPVQHQHAASTPEYLEAFAQALNAADKNRAETHLHDLLSVEPHNTQALCALARLLADRGNLASAHLLCNKVITLDPISRDGYYLLGQLHEQQREWEQALNAYRRTVFIDKDFLPGMLGLAQVWYALGRLRDAQRSYKNVLTHLQQLPASTTFPELDNVTVAQLIHDVAQYV